VSKSKDGVAPIDPKHHVPEKIHDNVEPPENKEPDHMPRTNKAPGKKPAASDFGFPICKFLNFI